MEGVFSISNLILLALAVVILLRLRSVLGRRVGNERPPPEASMFSGEPAETQPEAETAARPEPGLEPEPLAGATNETTHLDRRLKEIALADRSFHPQRFLEGARIAYERIETGFAAGARDSLRALLGDAAFQRFDAVMRERDARGEQAVCEVVKIHEADITHAEMRALQALITVRFRADLLSFVHDSEGNLVSGDDTAPRRAEDVWTFERNTRDKDPNWRLVHTGGA